LKIFFEIDGLRIKLRTKSPLIYAFMQKNNFTVHPAGKGYIANYRLSDAKLHYGFVTVIANCEKRSRSNQTFNEHVF
jgi:hypothetical protein